jgi:predicted metal-binding membrane protein
MSETALEATLRRDRAVVAAALVALTALAWIYILQLSSDMDMGGMEMPGFRMTSTGLGMAMLPAQTPWNITEFLLLFAMWAVMMVGMMTPSATPMILIYARAGRIAAGAGKPLAATGWFVAGYLLAWTGFALAATTAQWALQRFALLDPMMMSASNLLGGVLLIIAGLYQWTPLKHACLSACQSPLLFIQRYGGFQGDVAGALRLGGEHGIYCVGCCWALMVLLFVGGVMNVLWIAALATFALLEKAVPSGRIISWIAGVSLIAAGIYLLLT